MIGAALLLQVAAAMPLLEQGRFADARAPLEKACAAREANGCYLLGRTLYTLDQYEAALRVLTPLAATDRDPWRVQDALGSVYEALRRPAEAERAFAQAVSGNRDRTADPRHCHSYAGGGEIPAARIGALRVRPGAVSNRTLCRGGNTIKPRPLLGRGAAIVGKIEAAGTAIS
jgi:tetratricopeptide (TPR) repeat protein